MMPTYLTGMILGGILISLLGSLGEYLRESTWPKPKAMTRDFLIGAMLVVFLMQILPESMTNLLGFLPSFEALRDKLSSLGSLTTAVGASGDISGPDLQLGPVRF